MDNTVCMVLILLEVKFFIIVLGSYSEKFILLCTLNTCFIFYEATSSSCDISGGKSIGK